MARTGQHRDRLLQAAVRLFRQKGYAATGLSEILSISGAPRGSLYHYFPGGKEEIGAEAVRSAGRAVEQTLTDLVQRTAGSNEFIIAYTGQLGDWIAASGYRDGCPVATTLLETTPRSERIAAAGREVIESWTNAIAVAFRRDGFDEPASRKQALLLISTIEGALLMARVLRDTAPLAAIVEAFASMQFSKTSASGTGA